jgi:ParB/RepB/Spo0J family partition protein
MEKQENTTLVTLSALRPPIRKNLPIDSLTESGLNHRTKITDKSVAGLAQTIRENGIIQPLVVRLHVNGVGGGLQVICGNRRWRAAKVAGLKEVPADVYGEDLTDAIAKNIIAVENIQRADLHPLEQAEELAELNQVYPDLKVLAAKVGLEAGYVRLIIQLTKLGVACRKAFLEEKFSLDHAIELARLPDEKTQAEMLKWMAQNQYDESVHNLRNQIKRTYYLSIGKAPFPIEDATLYPVAGSCVTCPKRSGENPLLFPDIKEADICTDARCYDQKVALHIAKTQKLWSESHPDQPMVPLSSGWQQVKGGVLNRNEYDVVTGKAAKDPKVHTGIIVSGQEDLGKVVTFLKRSEKDPEPMTKQEKIGKYQSRERMIETVQTSEEDMVSIPAILKVIRASKKLTLEELQFIAHDAIARGYHDFLMKACKGMGLAIRETQYHTKDPSATLELNAQERIKDLPSLAFWLMEFSLYRHVGNAREHNYIHQLAKARKVNLKEAMAPVQANAEVKKARARKRWGVADKPPAAKKAAKKGH